ncbi:MAG: hypothetical protein ACLGG6_09525, partial [Gammaproteobacteria bacterium]
MKPVLSLLALALLLAGCLNVGNGSTSTTVVYHVLKDPAPAAEAAPLRADAPTLLVLDTTTGSFYDTEQLVFSRTPGTRGQYQFARWTEWPGKRFADLMRARLDRMGSYQVAAAGGLGPLVGKAFRIGHLGDQNEATILGALGGIEAALRALGI